MNQEVLIVHQDGNAVININEELTQKLVTVEADRVTFESGKEQAMLRLVFSPDRSPQLTYKMKSMADAYAAVASISTALAEYRNRIVSKDSKAARDYLDELIKKYPEQENDLECLMTLIRRLN